MEVATQHPEKSATLFTFRAAPRALNRPSFFLVTLLCPGPLGTPNDNWEVSEISLSPTLPFDKGQTETQEGRLAQDHKQIGDRAPLLWKDLGRVPTDLG